MIYTILTCLVILFEVLCVISFIFMFAKRKKVVSVDTAWYFVPTVIILYALYCIGLCHGAETSGEPLSFYHFVNVLNRCYSVFKGSISLSEVESIMFSDVVFRIAFFIAVAFALITLFLVFAGVIKFFFINKIKGRRLLRSGCDVLIGKSADNETYIKSHKDTLLWVDYPLTEDEKKYLREKKITYIVAEFSAEYIEKFLSKVEDREFHLIALDGKDKNLRYISEFKNFLDKTKSKNVFLYVKLDYDNYITINNKILEDKKYTAYISCFNEYELMARKFVESYPITRFMPNEFFDFDLACIKEGVTINQFFFGFGKVGSAIYRAGVMNDQLPMVTGGKHGGDVEQAFVNYYAYDKIDKKNESKNSNYYSNRFFLDHDRFKDKAYFEVPDKLCNFSFSPNSIDHIESFENFKITALSGGNVYNSIVVAFGDDVSNVDYALKLVMLFKQNDFENYHIFIRVRKYQKEYDEFFDSRATFFGFNDFIINHKIIVDENLTMKAKSVNSSYEQKSKEMSKWASLSAIKKLSNVYSGLNVRLKLNLMGYDLDDNDGNNFSQSILDELKSKLVEGSPKEDAKYEEYFFFDKDVVTPSNVLAYQEKLRWNSFYINNGYIPMQKSDITIIPDGSKNGCLYKDDDDKKLHACITTAKGLDEYHRLIAKLRSEYTGEPFTQCLSDMQTYKYDYSFDKVVDAFDSLGETVVVRKV
ncbi:MAG: hypothetical protein E7369_03360 [Clostridiales bacterium]|nr:hypothetical protein [Clostridiales bacterium]